MDRAPNHLHVTAPTRMWLAPLVQSLRQRFGVEQPDEEPAKAPKSPATLRRRAANKAARRARRVHRVRAAR